MEDFNKQLTTYIETFAEQHGISYKLLVGKQRDKWIIEIRTALVKQLREVFELSYPTIGKHLNRHHTSIMNLYKRNHELEKLKIKIAKETEKLKKLK